MIITYHPEEGAEKCAQEIYEQLRSDRKLSYETRRNLQKLIEKNPLTKKEDSEKYKPF